MCSICICTCISACVNFHFFLCIGVCMHVVFCQALLWPKSVCIKHNPVVTAQKKTSTFFFLAASSSCCCFLILASSSSAFFFLAASSLLALHCTHAESSYPYQPLSLACCSNRNIQSSWNWCAQRDIKTKSSRAGNSHTDERSNEVRELSVQFVYLSRYMW